MRTSAVEEERAQCDELPKEVENGETVILTRRGQPVAHEFNDAVAAMEEIYRLRRELRPTLGGMSIRELIEEGRT